MLIRCPARVCDLQGELSRDCVGHLAEYTRHCLEQQQKQSDSSALGCSRLRQPEAELSDWYKHNLGMLPIPRPAWCLTMHILCETRTSVAIC